ncbi:MAG: sulfite exporter TauE/SafE family protein [Promethearchaeota archaeon]
MELELFQVIILIITGAAVGISMSFIGQTGSGIVIPIVYLMTGDILLAVATNILNDLIAALAVSISYLKNKNYEMIKENFYLLGISIAISIICVAILMLTNLSNIYGILMPILFIVIGIGVLRKGFPTAESIKETVHKITEKFFKGKKSEEDIVELEEKLDIQIDSGNQIIEGIIPIGSKLFFISVLLVGILLGINSGLFGAGGGFIIAVVLILWGYPLKKAVGTALIFGIGICLSTFVIFQVFGYFFHGRFFVDWTITLYLAIGAISIGLVMSVLVQDMSAKTMGAGMGSVMILLGTITLIIYFMR